MTNEDRLPGGGGGVDVAPADGGAMWRPWQLLVQDQAYAVVAFALLVCLVFAVTIKDFDTAGNWKNIGSSLAGLGILALGEAIVVLGRGLDLSLAAIYGVTAELTATLLGNHHGQSASLVIALAVAVGLGLVNGVLVAYIDLPPLFVTLGTSLFYVGLFEIAVFHNSVTFSFPSSAHFISSVGNGTAAGVPVSAIIWIVAAVVCWVLTKKSALGRMVYAIGDNHATARLTGVPTRPLTALTYVVSAILAFIGGIVIAGGAKNFNTSGTSTGSVLYTVIAIVVIGGVSLAGGRGTIVGVVAATFLIGIILNGMILLNLDTVQQALFQYLIVLAALVLDRYLHPIDEETARTGDL